MQHKLKQYFLDDIPVYTRNLVGNQIQQAWIRLSLCLVSSVFLWVHAPDLRAHLTLFIITLLAYIGLQVLTLLQVRKKPLSLPRFALATLFDAGFLSMALLMDGGQFSPFYLFYFLFIMSAGLRFGNRALLYTQALSLIVFPLTCMFLWVRHGVAMDIPVFFIQILALIVLPLYIRRANLTAYHAIHTKQKAESTSLQLLNTSPVAIFTFQKDGAGQLCIDYVNEALLNITHRQQSDLIGQPIQDLFQSDDMDEIQKACQQVFLHTNSQPTFYIRTEHQHEQFQLLGNVRYCHFHGRDIGICFLTDITQQQLMTQKMQQNMQAGYMSTLVAGMVHDFRNVLTNIMGTAEIMQFEKHDATTMEQLETIIQSGEQGSRMISNLLTLGKASQQEDEADQGSQHMLQALGSMVDLLRIQLPKSIHLSLHTPEQLPDISIRLAQLEQILINLINNASQACPNGGKIQLTISHNTLADPAVVVIQVKDSGIGIAKEDLDKVTQPFWTSRKDSGGTGLGLAMVKRLVLQHQGHFDIRSTLGHGTCVTLTFPIVATDKQAESQPEAGPLPEQSPCPPATGATETKTWNILLIDDNEDVLLVHQNMLERMGHCVTTAHNGQAALDIYAADEGYFDLIVTDFMMPGLDGMGVCQAIRKKNTDIPIIMVTAFGDDAKLQQASALNVHLLPKPIPFQQLKSNIDSLQAAAN